MEQVNAFSRAQEATLLANDQVDCVLPICIVAAGPGGNSLVVHAGVLKAEEELRRPRVSTSELPLPGMQSALAGVKNLV